MTERRKKKTKRRGEKAANRNARDHVAESRGSDGSPRLPNGPGVRAVPRTDGAALAGLALRAQHEGPAQRSRSEQLLPEQRRPGQSSHTFASFSFIFLFSRVSAPTRYFSWLKSRACILNQLPAPKDTLSRNDSGQITLLSDNVDTRGAAFICISLGFAKRMRPSRTVFTAHRYQNRQHAGQSFDQLKSVGMALSRERTLFLET